jgi:uncharacterized membrane protein
MGLLARSGDFKRKNEMMPQRGVTGSRRRPWYHRFTFFSGRNEVEATPAETATDAAEHQPETSLVTLAHIVYGLHALSIVVGVLSAATVIGSFLFGLPSIVAVIINYVKRSDVRGTWLDSHFRWQIRTFWYGLAWSLVGALLVITILGLLVAWAVFLGAGIWVIYRVARGWLTLKDGKPMVFGAGP